ncbi:MAG: hypothetical protein AB1603_04360 [Chloroflexota bacterium]
MIIRVTKAMAEGRLGDVLPEKAFWCTDGRVLKNLYELESALREMSDWAFRYHASETKNDFSIWVREVVGDDKLSHDLQKSTTQAQAAKYVAARIAWLRTKLAGS